MSENSKVLRSFGRIRGRKLRPHAKGLMEGLLPQLVIGIEELKNWRTEEKKVSSIPQFLNSLVPLWLEIGFGGGEHLAHIASLHPDIAMIGCEPYVNGISGLLKHIEQHDCENIRIYTQDARDLLETMPARCLDRVYILYPDPWPKARHHKRRLIQKPLLDMLAKVMKPGAELRIATDWDDYATWILEQLLPHPAFIWTAEKATDWAQAWDEWSPTRYEQKARREGRGSCYFRFTRKA